jgi:hypothetical protein
LFDTDRYGNVDVAVVEVAVNIGAVIVLYAVKSPLKIPFPPKSELPTTSRILPVVVVAEPPTIKTSLVSVGCTARESVVVEKNPLPPDETVAQESPPAPFVERICPLEPSEPGNRYSTPLNVVEELNHAGPVTVSSVDEALPAVRSPVNQDCPLADNSVDEALTKVESPVIFK